MKSIWVLAMLLATGQAMAAPLVLISIDGLRPDDLYASAGDAVPLPHLRALCIR